MRKFEGLPGMVLRGTHVKMRFANHVFMGLPFMTRCFRILFFTATFSSSTLSFINNTEISICQPIRPVVYINFTIGPFDTKKIMDKAGWQFHR